MRVMSSYAASALGSTEFIEPNPLTLSTCVIPYDQFDEIKMTLKTYVLY
jgi:hypothetical protein